MIGADNGCGSSHAGHVLPPLGCLATVFVALLQARLQQLLADLLEQFLGAFRLAAGDTCCIRRNTAGSPRCAPTESLGDSLFMPTPRAETARYGLYKPVVVKRL